MAEPNWKLEDDYKTVTVTFPTEPEIVLKLTTADIEDMLKNLGMFRGAMRPEVPREFALRQKVDAIPDPIWVTESELMEGNSLLHIRDPHYGWLHYVIPRETARKLAGLLQTQADAPPNGQPQGKAH